jgi:hypothetical protein
MKVTQGRVVGRALVLALAAMALAVIAAGCSSTPATTSAAMMAITTTQSSSTTASTELLPYTIQEQTVNEGILEYECDENGCWRMGSALTHPPEYYYPDIEAQNPDISALLADIGNVQEPILDDAIAWKVIMELWAWLGRNTYDPGESVPPGPMAYLYSLSYEQEPNQFPSIDDFAKVYARYQVIPWSGCTGRALTFVTLLYRCGIDPNKVAAAYYVAPDRSVTHYYVVIRSGDHWYYVDPSSNVPWSVPELPAEPANVGRVPGVDYEHPSTLAVIPGSTLARAMLVK